jgi:hypothetical protein
MSKSREKKYGFFHLFDVEVPMQQKKIDLGNHKDFISR